MIDGVIENDGVITQVNRSLDDERVAHDSGPKSQTCGSRRQHKFGSTGWSQGTGTKNRYLKEKETTMICWFVS